MADNAFLHAHLDAGLRAHSQGNIEAAKDAFQRALALAPGHPDALHLYGVTLLQLGEIAPALDSLQRAARLQRNNPAVAGNLAQAYFAAGRYAEAGAAFRNASRLNPREAQYQLGVANSLAMSGALADAETLLRKLITRFPDNAYAHFNLGNVRRDAGNTPDAIASYRRALELAPQLADARNNLGGVLHRLLDFEAAEREFRACIEHAPDYLLARCNLASVLIDLGRFSEGEAICREVIALAPEFELAHRYLGAALGHQGRRAEALTSYDTALHLAPNDAKLVQTYGATLVDCGNYHAGTNWLSRALAMDPQIDSSHLLLGYALLGHGCLAEGWAHYAKRPWPAIFREQYPQRELARELPAAIAGKHLCVVKEQGLGDEIFFLRWAPQLHAAGARITYIAGNKIARLLTRVPAITQVLDEAAALPPADTVMLVGDLARALSDYPASPLPAAANFAPAGARRFPERISIFFPPVAPPLVLTPCANRLAELKGRLAALGQPPYIGLTWRGGTPPREQRAVIWALFKEIGIPPLAAALKDIPGTFVALQRNPLPEELAAVAAALGRPVHDLSALNEDLEDMLALLALLDEYVAVSNTNVHLRASVNRPTRLLAPCPAEWRWLHSGRSSPWFPGSTIYRQSPHGDWSAALAELKRDLGLMYPPYNL